MAWEKLYGDDELTWADIRSEKMSEVWSKLYADPNFAEIDNILSQLQLDISKIIKYQLHDQYKDLLDDVLSDLKGCIYSRAIERGTNAFFEQIFSAYKTGCWSCGWNGEWPEGKIFIYCNKNNNQTEIDKTMRNSN